MSRRPAAASLTSRTNATRRTATREIIESLRHSIASGELARGERLPPETELAAHFEVSQPTVREAMRALEAMGLVEVRHGSGAYVTGDPTQFIATSLHTLLQIDHVGIIEVFEMRGALAVYSAARAVRCATDEDLDLIEQQERRLADVATESDLQHIADAAVAFQISMSAAAHNPLLLAIESVLAELLIRLQADALAQRDQTFWRERSLHFSRDRHALIASLRARDEQRAIEAMNNYLDTQRNWYTSDPTLIDARLSDPEILRVVRPLGFERLESRFR
ncbi:FadR/GntR family transcriptional regulator [Amycolatopsis pithecellobii]|uniref:FadR/GntR family transcriptional regulator n=1 Tax=Amycolatopsis pithecellobii TaxID=664692 RepID=UPI00140BF0EB|nr:GntR family transcriptional regulator [Amycolatopsis pithecellobii]